MFEVDKMKKKLWFLFIGFSIICSFLNAQQTITVRADKLRLSSGTVVTITSLAPYDAKYFTSQAEGGLSAEEVVTANGKSLIQASDYAAMKALLDLEIGTDIQAQNAVLAELTALTDPAADRFVFWNDTSNNFEFTTSGGAPSDAKYFTSQAESGLSAEEVVTANGKSLIQAANYAAMRTLLDLEVGTDFNAYITALSGITNGIKVTGATAQYVEITHDGTDTIINSSVGSINLQKTGGTGAAILALSDGSSNYINLTAPSIAADYTFIFPVAIGAEGQLLRTGASPFATAWTTATFPATAGNAGNALISDGTNWSSANVLSAVPTGLTYTTATRALSLTANYFIPDTASGWTFDHLHITKGVYYTETDDGNSSTADTIDWTVGPAHKSTLTGNCTYTFTAPPSPCSLILRIVGDGTVRTVTWPSTVKWAAATKPTHTGTASVIDLIAFYFDGTNYWAGATLDIR